MLTFADALRTERAQLLADAIDAGSAGTATLTVYSGARPYPGALPVPPPLVVLLFAHPSAQAVSGGVLTLKPLAEQLVTGNGIPSWGRICNRDGGFVADLDVGPPGSGADIEIPADSLFTGAMVRINSATLTEP